MADILGISSIAYGDIERCKTNVSYSRLEQISKALGIDVVNLLSHGEQLANIFSNCTHNHVVGSGNVVNSEKELRHELEKVQLQLAKEIAEKSQAQTEAKYWKEKYERLANV
jgi:XRE family transcriptional regulator, regulator of sulfur utilization